MSMGGDDDTDFCDICGADSTYSETISGDDDNAIRSITTTGCPNHYNENNKGMGPGTTEAGFQGDPNTTYTVPAYPVIATTPEDATCIAGQIGVALNGVSFFGQSDGTSACGDATSSEGATFDNCGGHATNQGWEYHYHLPPACLLDQIGNPSGSHSPQIGWANDGFPLYGPQGPSGVQMMPCDVSGADSTYCAWMQR